MVRKLWSVVFRAVIGILVLSLGLLGACATQAPVISATDEAAIYAAVIRQLYTTDDTFGGTLRPATVFLVSRTDDGVGDPDSERSDPKVLAESLQDEIVTALADLPADFIWVDARQDVALDANTGEVVGGGVIITLGNVHLQQDSSVDVSGSIYIASLAAGGQTYRVAQEAGVWKIVGTTGVQWIS